MNLPENFKGEVAQCFQTQQTNDQFMNQSHGISQDTGATFEGGTKRSGRKPAYHLVMVELMQAVAKTRAEGDRKYQPGNWMKGNKEFFVDCLGHAIEHLMLCAWDEEEDIFTHLGHAATNIGFILWALIRGKVTRRDFQRAAVVDLDEKLEALMAAQQQLQTQQSGMPLMNSSREPSPTTTKPFFGYSIAGIPRD
jgi:hypothetical protein